MSIAHKQISTVFHSVFDRIEALGFKKVLDFQTFKGICIVDTFEAMGVKCAETPVDGGSIKSIVSKGIKVLKDAEGNISFLLGTEDSLNMLSDELFS